MSKSFELYDLRVVVVSIEGRSVCGLQVGDYFELTESSRLRIPADKHFCVYALSAVLPLLAAKQRQLAENDWLEQDSLVVCPDPEERLVMKIERINKRVMDSDELTEMTLRRKEVSIAFQTDKTPTQYIALAQLVNQYDFDAVSVYCDLPYHPSFGPLLLMAPHISRARVGVAAVSPSRMPPIDMAANVALLSQVAKGGVYLGISRGAWLEEHGIHEVLLPIQAIRECIEIIKRLLSGDFQGYAGRVYQVAAHVYPPYALPSEPVPILIGTWGAKLCALAGEVADEVKVGGSANPDLVPIIRSYISEGEQLAGRVPESVGIVMGAVTVVDEDRAAARQAARRSVALYLPIVAPLDPTLQIDPELITRLQSHVQRQELDAASGLISDDLLNRFAFSGNPGDIIEQALALYSAGAARIEFGTPHGIRSEVGISLLGEKVLPMIKHTD